MIHDYQLTNHVAVIGTSISKNKLNPVIISPRGKHLFSVIVEIPEMEKVIIIDVWNFMHYLTDFAQHEG